MPCGWSSYQTSRENKYVEVRRTLEDFVRTRSKADEKFQSFVYEELAVLKNDISKETQVSSISLSVSIERLTHCAVM